MDASKDIRIERTASVFEKLGNEARCIITSVGDNWHAYATEMYEGYILISITSHTDDESDIVQAIIPVDIAKKLLSSLGTTIQSMGGNDNE